VNGGPTRVTESTWHEPVKRATAVVEPALAAAPVRALESGGESQVVLKRRPAKALVTTNHAGFL